MLTKTCDPGTRIQFVDRIEGDPINHDIEKALRKVLAADLPAFGRVIVTFKSGHICLVRIEQTATADTRPTATRGAEAS